MQILSYNWKKQTVTFCLVCKKWLYLIMKSLLYWKVAILTRFERSEDWNNLKSAQKQMFLSYFNPFHKKIGNVGRLEWLFTKEFQIRPTSN